MKRTAYVLILIALVLSACATSTMERQYSGSSEPSYDAGIAPAPDAMEAMPTPSGYNTDNVQASGAAPQERMVIQNADLSIVVADPQSRMNTIAQMAEEMGGFVVSSNMYQTYAPDGTMVPEGYIMIRIPAAQLDAALTQVKADVVEVRSETRSGQDVTQEYVDLKSRLRSLEAARDQLEQIMLAAEKTEDVLAVFGQLEYYNTQIELVKGQMQYYEQSSDTSAISVTLIAEETIQPIEIGGWKPEGVARDAIQSLINFLQGVVDFLIRFFLNYLWVLIIIFGPWVALAFIIRAIVHRRKAKKAQKAAG